MSRRMPTKKRIAILTGGGDVPGLNAVIKSVVYRATEAGSEVLGLRRGWEGLTHVQPELADGGPAGYLRPLDRINTRTIDRTGGTILHTSRTNPRKMRTAALPPWLPDDRVREVRGRRRRPRPDPARARPPRRARRRCARHDRRRRHAVVLAGPGRRRRRAGGHPQDDGQRRPRDRVLHRLLDGHHPGQGGDQSPADHARLARADRRVPHLRTRRRLLGAVHGVRHVRPLRHPRGALRPRRAGHACWPRTTPPTRATTRS